MIHHLIFDCDGVLVDSEIIAAQVMVEQLALHGIDISIPYYLRYCTGKTFSGLRIELQEQFETPLPDSFIEDTTLAIDSRVKTQLQPIEGIYQVLENATLPKAVVSNSELYQIEHAIQHINIVHHFGTKLFSSEMVATPKPDPAVYLHAAQQLQVSPEACLVVEDSLSGATAALKAGMKVIGFCAGSHIIEGHAERLVQLGVEKVAEDSEQLDQIIATYTDSNPI